MVTTEVRLFSEILAGPLYIALYLQDFYAKENLAHPGLLRADELLSVKYKEINIEEHKMIIFYSKEKERPVSGRTFQ